MKMASKNKIIETIACIKSIYPYFAKDTNVEVLVKTWALLLKDYSDQEIEAALFKALQTCETPPTPAHIIKIIESMHELNEASDEELWSELTKALRTVEMEVYRIKYPLLGVDHRQNIQQVWNKLSPKIRLYLGSVGELMRMASNYTDDELKFEKNRFLKAMPTLKTRTDYMALAAKHNLLIEG